MPCIKDMSIGVKDRKLWLTYKSSSPETGPTAMRLGSIKMNYQG